MANQILTLEVAQGMGAAHGDLVFAIGRDNTEHKMAEQALREEREKVKEVYSIW